MGIIVGRYREELAAKEAAKQHRLYSAAPFPGSPTAAAVAAGGDRAGAASPSPGHCHHHQQQHQPAAATEAEPGGGHAPGGRQAAGPAGTGVGAAADWEAAQRQHEDANLGHFERILPSDDPQQQVCVCVCMSDCRHVSVGLEGGRGPSGLQACALANTGHVGGAVQGGRQGEQDEAAGAGLAL